MQNYHHLSVKYQRKAISNGHKFRDCVEKQKTINGSTEMHSLFFFEKCNYNNNIEAEIHEDLRIF